MAEPPSVSLAVRAVSSLRRVLTAATHFWPPSREMQFYPTDLPRLLQVVVYVHESRAWEGAGFKSWDDMCTNDLRTGKPWPDDARASMAAAMFHNGIPVRDIAVFTGVGVQQTKDDVVTGHLQETAQ